MTTSRRYAEGSAVRQYVLEKNLSEDVIGSVWKARDTLLGRVVVLKFIGPALTEDASSRDHLVSEARHAGHLVHPNIAMVYELVETGEDTFLVYEYVDGEPLSGLIRETPLDRSRLVLLAVQIADALHVAHLADVLHGNLHPWDVIIGPDDQVKIYGFGTGRASTTAGPIAELAERAEQAFYFSPERVAGRALQVHSDIFTLGTILYQMATGHVPFPGTTASEVCVRVVNAPPPAPQLHKKDIDLQLVRIIGRCIHKEIGRRYQSVAQILLDLGQLGVPESAEHSAPAVSHAPEERQSAVHHPAAVIAAATPAAAVDAPPVPGRTFELEFDEPPAPVAPVVVRPQAERPSSDPAAREPAAAPRAPELSLDDISSSVGDALSQFDATEIRPDREPEAQPVAVEYETNIVDARSSIIFFAALPPASAEGSEAARLSGRMQQILGEAVYLFGGRIIDPFGSRMIAEFNDPSDALRAARKGREDLDAYNSSSANRMRQILARMVVHAGEAKTVAGGVAGPVVEAAQSVAATLPPSAPVVSATVLRMLRLDPEDAPLANVPEPFYPVPPERVAPVEPEPEPEAERTLVASTRPDAKRPPALIIGAAVGVVILLFAAGGAVAWRSAKAKAEAVEAQRKAEAAQRKLTPPPAPLEREVAVDPFWVEIASAGVAAPPAESMRLAVMGILDSHPDLKVVDSAGVQDKFGASIVEGASGLEVVPMRIAPQSQRGSAFPFRDSAQATRALALWIAGQLRVSPPSYIGTNPHTIDLFARAVAEKRASGSQVTPQLASLAGSLAKADANFIPGQMLALETFERQRSDAEAIAAARAILALDARDLAVRKRLAALEAQSGRPADALAQFVEIQKERPADREAAEAIAIYALAANDQIVFERMLKRLDEIGAARRLHQPDVLLVEGKIDQAADPLFDLEAADPQNAALALKIGRVAVLRRMMTIADIELRKLRTLDSSFGYPMLRAYVLAERRDRANALVELDRAIAVARWDDLPYTRAAEVHAILGNTSGVIESLERAVERGEPSGAYILNSPLFRFLSNDRRFRILRERMESQMREVRSALASVPV